MISLSIRIKVTTVICIMLLACSSKPSVEKIKQPVFGGLILGCTNSEFSKTIDSLTNTEQLHLANNTRYPYFLIDDSYSFSNVKLLFFPMSFYTDSIITKYVYYVYGFRFVTEAMINQPAPDDWKKNLVDKAQEINTKYFKVTHNFSLTDNIDKQFGFKVPIIPSAKQYEDISLKSDILSLITKKYGGSTAIDTVGDKFDINQTYLEKHTWEKERYNINLILKRYENQESFCLILLYEYNSQTKKEYNLENSKRDLKNTF